MAKLCEFETIDPKSVKAYHSLRAQWAMGKGAPAGFAHCQVSVLAGRPPELRTKIARAMFETLQEECADSLLAGETGITVEVREMEPGTYFK